ncbi:MAG TPA: DegT/DnrJ/EryC1/StrS family aminotransferase, partial [Bacteroidia bacterium]|nr:DegT/DnrJ/EryC1/StrS family aminotransferase [Bacteroidia bacterium]
MTKISHSKSTLNKTEIRAVTGAIERGQISSGTKASKFLSSFKDYIQADNVLFYSSGSSGLFNILLALGISKNEEILLPNYICNSVLKAVEVAGAIPVLYDNSAEKWTSSITEIEKLITTKTKAIVINHTFGIFNYAIEKLKQKNIFIIEDCCHLLTIPSKEFPITYFSDAAFFSFNATKLLATGEGGAVLTYNKVFFNELKKIKLDNPISDISAAIGVAQLRKYDDFLLRRKEIALIYDNAFQNINKNIEKSIYFRYPIMVPKESQTVFLNNVKVAYRKGIDNLLVF